MDFPVPTLAQMPAKKTAQTAVIWLSNLGECLILQVPDREEMAPNWQVYPILGADPDEPEWAGDEERCGEWDERLGDAVRCSGIELRIPKTALAAFENSEIELRYKFVDESNFEPYSEPLLLVIRP